MEILRITHQDSLMQNSYLVLNKNRAILIDCGCNMDELQQEYFRLTKSNNAPQIEAVLLTHLHFDHISGLKEFQKTYSCKVFCMANKKEYFSSPELNASFVVSSPLIYSPKNLVEIEDETPLNLIGLNIKPIFTPGHTSTSICYLIENYLFSGDTLFLNGVGRTDLHDSSEEELNNSLKKLYKQKYNYVCPGHGVLFKNNHC